MPVALFPSNVEIVVLMALKLAPRLKGPSRYAAPAVKYRTSIFPSIENHRCGPSYAPGYIVEFLKLSFLPQCDIP